MRRDFEEDSVYEPKFPPFEKREGWGSLICSVLCSLQNEYFREN
jgi:hypothetical protein